MTTARNKKQLGENRARENTEGVPLDGFQDPTGEYPKRDYHYGSSINKASRGLSVNNLYIGGGDFGVPLNLEDQEPSQFPFNKVTETESGHVIEYDDTPGGERILIKHRTGAGVEMRADGSVIVSAVNNKIEVTGGDQTTIVEGNGKLVYKGNLDLQVTGDFNLDVGGNYNVNVSGHNENSIQLNQRNFISGVQENVIKKSRSMKVVENNTDVILADNKHFVKGEDKKIVQKDYNIHTNSRYIMSAKDEMSLTSLKGLFSATQISVLGMQGVIGGEKVEMTSPVYMGPKGAVPFTSGACFYGTFRGQADEAIESYNANKAEEANFAFCSQFSKNADKPVSTSGGTPAPKSGVSSEMDVDLATDAQEDIQPVKPVPTTDQVGNILKVGDYAIRAVVVDAGDELKNKILLSDDYEGLFEKIPTLQEIRSTIRDPANRSKLAAKLVAEGRLSSTYNNPSPKTIGRTSTRNPSSRFGYVPLGNAIANRGKRFTP